MVAGGYGRHDGYGGYGGPVRVALDIREKAGSSGVPGTGDGA